MALTINGSLGKRGFVFTAVAVLIVFFMLVLAWGEGRGADRAQTRAEQALIAQSYITNLEADLPRAAYISSFRCFLALEEQVSESGEFIPDIDVAFGECFMNGSINGTQGALMEDSSFNDLTARFSSILGSRGLQLSITPVTASVEHASPFTVRTRVILEVRVYSIESTISLNRTILIEALVPITDIKDPLYSVRTAGRNPVPIRESTIARPYITPGNVTTNLLLLINTTQYILDSSGPDFLMRFEGNLSSSPNGIASLVPIADIAAQDLPIDTCKSIVDYKYFGPDDTTPNRLIVNTDGGEVWFSDSDLADYDAVGKTVGDKTCT